MDKFKDNPFAELPQMLVEEMLQRSISIGDELHASFIEAQKQKVILREEMLRQGFIRKDADFVPAFMPTTCGVDGACALERLLSIDFIASAAVALEGITPPAEKRHWETPHHCLFLTQDKHSVHSWVYSRSLMAIMEVALAAKAPHNVVLLDGSMLSPIVQLVIAGAHASRSDDSEVFSEIAKSVDTFMSGYTTILSSNRTDKCWVGFPKSTSSTELGKKFNWSDKYNDKALLTTLLEPGEFTKPVRFEVPDQLRDFNFSTLKKLPSIDKEIKNLYTNLEVFYYKPHSWNPAYRIELSPNVTSNDARMAILLHGIKLQASVPGILELYPLYIADRMVKHLGKALPALRQSSTRRMAELYDGDITDILFSMHSYRSD